LFAVLAAGCRHTNSPTITLDADADDEIGGSGVDSGDVRSLAQRMSRSLLALPLTSAEGAPRVAVQPLLNQSRFRIDAALIQNKLVAELVRRSAGKLLFLGNDDGHDTHAHHYVLQGELRSLSKSDGAVTSDYLVYSFKLIDAVGGGVVWMDDFETKKAAAIGVVYQ
jgi:penicillin-binding protein activator